MRRKTYHGVTIGILMVNTHFQRFPGDVGNAETWRFPVQYKIVKSTSAGAMINMHNESMLRSFLDAADELIAEGVDGIATTCGFLSLYQRELADHCSVPVATSSLLQVPMAQAMLPRGKRVGILTFNAEILSGAYLSSVGINQNVAVVGLPRRSRFADWVNEGPDDPPSDVSIAALRAEVLEMTDQLMSENQDIGAIVLECTNLAPFTFDIATRTRLPVFDIVTMINCFQACLNPTRFGIV